MMAGFDSRVPAMTLILIPPESNRVVIDASPDAYSHCAPTRANYMQTILDIFRCRIWGLRQFRRPRHLTRLGQPGEADSWNSRFKAWPGHLRRWGQPGQQHGLRMPSMSSEHTRSTCCFRVSGFFTEMVQQIHSLRASGVMSSQAACAAGDARSASLKSAGKVCTVPLESVFLATRRFYDVRWQGFRRPLVLEHGEEHQD